MKNFRSSVSFFIVIAMIVTFLPFNGIQALASGNITVYEAESTSGVSGSRIVKADRIVCDRDKGIVDYALYTPGQTISAGHYRVLLFANLLNEPNTSAPILSFDIFGDKGAGMEVMYDAYVLRSQFSELNKFQPVIVEFTTPTQLTNAQLRFRFEKNASIEIDKFALLKDDQFYINVEAENLATQLPTGSVKPNQGILASKYFTGQTLATAGWYGTIPAGQKKAVVYMKLVQKSGNSGNTFAAFTLAAETATTPREERYAFYINESMFPELNKYYPIEVPINSSEDLIGAEPYLWRLSNADGVCTFMVDRIEFTESDFNTTVADSKTYTYEAEICPSQANARSITSNGLAVSCDPAVNDPGYFIFGSDLSFQPGSYKITAVMKIKSRVANPNDRFAFLDIAHNIVGGPDSSNIYAIRDIQFASLDTWTNVDFYFKTAIAMTNTQIRMNSSDTVSFEVDQFIIQKLDDTASIIVQAENILGSLTGTFTSEGVKCVVGDSLSWATFYSQLILDEGKYNVLIYVKQLQKAENLNSAIFTFNLSYEEGGSGYSGFTKTFTQSDFPATVGEYKAFSVPVEVPQGKRFTASQMMVKFEGNTDIVVDRYEILPAIVFSNHLVSNNIITKVDVGTTVAGIKSAIAPAVATSVSNKGDAEAVGTGTTLDVTLNGYSQTYTVVIYGDTTGDGSIGAPDLIAVKKHILKINILTGAYKTAGDITNKGSISISDLLAIKKSILGVGTISQNPLG